MIGLVSWGYDCAAAGYPGVCTNIGALRSWWETHVDTPDPSAI
ncbi:hypothetical protein [Streptomyces sp. NPDC057682]